MTLAAGSAPAGPRHVPVKRHASVLLGKMLQSQSAAEDDTCRPYLRAANVQPDGRLAIEDVQEMWFTSTEVAQLDLRTGDVVVVEGGAGSGRSAVLTEPLEGWGFQNSIVRVRPNEGALDGRYLDFALQHALANGQIAVACNAATIPHFTAEKVGAFRIPTPDFATQQRLGRWLTSKTAIAENLDAKQRELIDRLTERRQALIDHTVWSGLRSASPAPTGIDPAPTAPAAWKRTRNRALLQERSNVSVTGDEEMLSVSHLTGVTPRADKNVTMFEAASNEGYRLVSPGNLVINTMWAWMGALGVSAHEGIVSPAYGVYAFHDDVDTRYFEYLYRSRPYVTEMTRYSRGIWTSRLRLYPNVFQRLRIVVPPRDEQTEIADFLDEATGKIDALIGKTEHFIARAKERRTALVAAVVTGVLDPVGET